MTLGLRLVPAAACALLLGGCALAPRSTPPLSNSTQTWMAVLAQADQQVASGQYAAAERLLVQFHQAHPGTPEAPEALFYRALYRLDPANPASSAQEAVGLLDSFLALRIVSPHRNDAMVLRRIAIALDAKPTVVTVPVVRAPSGSGGGASRADTGSKDEEISRLRDELAKANAEVERIRRRLATPAP